MDDECDVSKLIARVTSAGEPDAAVTPIDATPSCEHGDVFFPNSESSFREVPVFRHKVLSDLQN